MFFDPGRDLLPQVLPLLRHRRREDLHAVESRRRVVLMLCHRFIDSFWRLYVSPYSSVPSPTAMFASPATENASSPASMLKASLRLSPVRFDLRQRRLFWRGTESHLRLQLRECHIRSARSFELLELLLQRIAGQLAAQLRRRLGLRLDLLHLLVHALEGVERAVVGQTA